MSTIDFPDEQLIIFLYAREQGEMTRATFTGMRHGRTITFEQHPERKRVHVLSFKMDEDVPSMLTQRHSRIRDMFLSYMNEEIPDLLINYHSIEILSYNFIGSTNIPHNYEE